MEEWKAIKGYEGRYEVSNTGKVRSLDYHRRGIIKELKISVDRYGYPCISLPTGGNKKKHFTIHRLVAMAFLANPEDKPEVNHKDGNKLNNHADNLEWVTMQENQRHAWGNGLKEGSRRMSSERGKSAATLERLSVCNDQRRKRIVAQNLETGTETTYETQREAAIAIGGDQGNIQRVLKGRAKQHKGYTFRYAQEEE